MGLSLSDTANYSLKYDHQTQSTPQTDSSKTRHSSQFNLPQQAVLLQSVALYGLGY